MRRCSHVFFIIWRTLRARGARLIISRHGAEHPPLKTRQRAALAVGS